MEKKELVSFRGMVDGVRINLGEDSGIFDILTELEKKILQSKAFFGDGDCHISFSGRHLSSVDKQRLEELAKRLMPLCRISFDEENKKAAQQTDWILAYKERDTEAQAQQPEEKPAENTDESGFVSILRSNRARLYQGVVKPGLTLRSDGHLVLLGTVLEGAALIATGNIIVIGGLYGTAHAGCNGHNGSYIIAMDMRPEGLAIAQTGEEYVYGDNPPADAEPDIEEKKTFFEKFKKKTEQIEEEKKEETEFCAVALLKNNKIVIDNFTIQDFTNLKNML